MIVTDIDYKSLPIYLFFYILLQVSTRQKATEWLVAGYLYVCLFIIIRSCIWLLIYLSIYPLLHLSLICLFMFIILSMSINLITWQSILCYLLCTCSLILYRNKNQICRIFFYTALNVCLHLLCLKQSNKIRSRTFQKFLGNRQFCYSYYKSQMYVSITDVIMMLTTMISKTTAWDLLKWS